MVTNQLINDQDKSKKQLKLLLQDEMLFTQNLFGSLERESEALIAKDIPALERIAAEKLELIRQLELFGKQRETLFASIGDNELFENTLFSSQWQELLTLAAKCQNKNYINGTIIKVGFRQSQQALDILQGTSSKPELYDHSGLTSRSSTSSTIAQA